MILLDEQMIAKSRCKIQLLVILNQVIMNLYCMLWRPPLIFIDLKTGSPISLNMVAIDIICLI